MAHMEFSVNYLKTKSILQADGKQTDQVWMEAAQTNGVKIQYRIIGDKDEVADFIAGVDLKKPVSLVMKDTVQGAAAITQQITQAPPDDKKKKKAKAQNLAQQATQAVQNIP